MKIKLMNLKIMNITLIFHNICKKTLMVIKGILNFQELLNLNPHPKNTYKIIRMKI